MSEKKTDPVHLDPRNWDDYKEICHKMLEQSLSFLQNIRSQKVWVEVPQSVKDKINQPLPLHDTDISEVCEEFNNLILPYRTGNIHPSFFGWVHGAGTANGILAEMLCATMNSNVGGRDHGAVYIERQILTWWKQILGFPMTASGILTSGTSVATLLALQIARDKKLEHIGNRTGNFFESLNQLTFYVSDQAHGCHTKAAKSLGINMQNVKKIPSRNTFTICLASLQSTLEEDLKKGLIPFCVIGTAGTVNTGSIDELDALAELSKTYNLWFHIDGAFGSLAMLSDKFKPLFTGLDKADSIAFDFHKWLHVPYDVGCLIVRDSNQHLKTFSEPQDYLAPAKQGLAGGDPWFCNYGLELSRGFKALKVWFLMKEKGTLQISKAIEKNCALAQYLKDLVIKNKNLELLAPVTLNIVCFRFIHDKISQEQLDEINKKIIEEIQNRGLAAPSLTRIKNQSCIRIAIVNHRTDYEDCDHLIENVILIASELLTQSI